MSRSAYYVTARLPDPLPTPSPDTCAYCGGHMDPRPLKRFCRPICRTAFNTAERKAAMARFRAEETDRAS